MTFSHSYPLYKHEWSREPSHKLRFLAQSLSVLCSPPTPFHQKYDFAKLIRFLFTIWWWVGSLQFRTTLFIHTVSSIPRDSSVLFSSFSTRSMVFAYFAKAQLPFSLFRDLFNDTAEFTLCYGLHDCSHLFQGYFIHSLSTLYYYNAPSLTTRLTGDYRDRTYTGKCSPALLDTRRKKEALLQALLLTILGLRSKVSGPQSGPFFKKSHEFI